MPRSVKCPFCGSFFLREEEKFVEYKGRYYHESCYEQLDKELKDKENLISYIKNLLQVDNLTPLVMRQINTYHDEYKYTYTGMKKALTYFTQVKNNEMKGAGIGIIPYIYKEAYDYFHKLWEIEQNNEEKQSVSKEGKITIKIRKPSRKPVLRLKPLSFKEKE